MEYRDDIHEHQRGTNTYMKDSYNYRNNYKDSYKNYPQSNRDNYSNGKSNSGNDMKNTNEYNVVSVGSKTGKIKKSKK